MINESYAEVTVVNAANGWVVTGDTIEEDGSFVVQQYIARTPEELALLIGRWAQNRALRNAVAQAHLPARHDALVE